MMLTLKTVCRNSGMLTDEQAPEKELNCLSCIVRDLQTQCFVSAKDSLARTILFRDVRKFNSLNFVRESLNKLSFSLKLPFDSAIL
ncbi:hypothetical protein RvY_15227 [Ramazzottius varieornatus]|uniref:Uncharacterized protein n=1 Tax=Ramazzottius varieornatus TaxID=947166 RepID=A0A1D1W294_RAMVA|nr:hypothetical protein RvY_15227 [Ramazzottius varieornatus]